MSSDKQKKEKTRQWIEDGILYNEYIGGLTLDDAVEATENSVNLIKEKQIKLVPLIIVFKDVDEGTFKVGLSGFGKVISSFGLISLVSTAWIVGASGGVKKTLEIFNKTFLSGRIRFKDTVEEARKEVVKERLSQDPILEQD